MTYASASRKPNPAAVLGALGIPGAMGALMVVGLAVTVVTAPQGPRLTAQTITETKLPPPPTPPETPPEAEAPRKDAIEIPAPPRPSLPPVAFTIGRPSPLPAGSGDIAATGTGTAPADFVVPVPTPVPQLFDPVGAQPRNNPARWVTNDDYRPRWIMEGMAGTARFTLAIDAGGRVTGCTVTRSTGFAPLDAATCELVERRARFEAARDATGKPVPGSYTGMITWKIP